MDKVTYRANGIPRREVKHSFLPNLFENIVVKILFLGISVFFIYSIVHSAYITKQKVDILKNARTEVEKLRVTNLELQTQLQNMQSTEYLEVEARDRLNFAEKNDVIFVISDELMNTAKERLKEIANDQVTASNKTVIEEWENFIIHGV